MSLVKKPLVEAAFGRKPDRQPIWFLRQAGRYLPEYMKIRSTVSFTELCASPELASEVTLQPLRRYDVDAAIIFSDILIPPTAMGQELTFGKGHGPQLSNTVRSADDLARLKSPDVEKDLGYVGDAIQLTKKGLSPTQTMIGFAGAPFTVATYMIEGSGSKVFTEVKKLLYGNLDTFKGLLELLTEVTIDYLSMQVRAGADCLMLFDTWANQLTAFDYHQHVLPCMKLITDEIKSRHPEIPLIYYPGQGSDLHRELLGLNVDVIAVDWRTRLNEAIANLKKLNMDYSVQGNLDPQALLGNEGFVRARVRQVIENATEARGHIFNVGHGLLPHLDPDSLSWVIDEIRN